MLDYHERHLVERQVLAETYRLNLSLYLVLVSLGIGDHHIECEDRVAISDSEELLTLSAHLAGIHEAVCPLFVLLVDDDLLGNQARLAQVSCLEHIGIADISLIKVSLLEYGPDCPLDRVVG